MLVFFFITPQSAKEAMCMFFFIASKVHKLHVVNISLIINIYDCGAVTGNGFLGDGVCRKAGIAFSRYICLRTGCTGFSYGLFQRIVVIICVFKPMNNGILRVVAGRPMCSNRSTCGNGLNFFFTDIPTVKTYSRCGSAPSKASVFCPVRRIRIEHSCRRQYRT